MPKSKGSDHFAVASNIDAAEYFKRLAKPRTASQKVYSSFERRAMYEWEVYQRILQDHYKEYL